MAFSLIEFSGGPHSRARGGSRHASGIDLGVLPHSAFRVARLLWRKLLGPRLSDPSDARNPLFPVPHALKNEHVKHGQLFANRLEMIASLPKGKVWAELGTFEGRFAKDIARLCEPAKLHLLDLDFTLLKSRGNILPSSTVTLHEGDSSATLDTFPDSYFDCVYIDGDHSLAGVARDAAVAVRKLKPDGILMFNDYILFSQSELYPYGTVPVVNSLCNDMGWEMVGLALHPKMYCDVMLRKRADNA